MRTVGGFHIPRLLALALLLSGCAAARPRDAPSTIPIVVRSHNRSEVEVYLLCGDRDAKRLGVVREEEAQTFEAPAERARCPAGLNFVLVLPMRNRVYWVGPLHLRPGASIRLIIEKYAGLSTASTSY